MTLQLDIFEPRTLARATDPDTSHEAAAKVNKFRGGHISVILACLQDHGPLPISHEQKQGRPPDYQLTYQGIPLRAVK